MKHSKNTYPKSLLTIALLIVGMLAPANLFAQDETETLIVTPINTRGWSTADTRPGGSVEFTVDTTSPAPGGALQLVTNATTAAKAQYMHATETALSEVVDLSYYTKQNSASFFNGAPSYQIPVLLDGTVATFTTLVFEPYNNGFNITSGAWQQWDVDAGTFWSSRNVNAGGACVVAAGAGGPPFYSLATLKSNCPNAVVVGFGVNIGTFNPSYDTEVDLVKFNNTTYDFEVYSTPSNAEECKKGGWSTFNPPTGPYKNQGQCVSSAVPAT